MKKLFILPLLFPVMLMAQSGETVVRNNKAQVTNWQLTKDSIEIDGLKHKFVRAYEKDNIIIGYAYKKISASSCIRYKLRIEFYPNPIKKVTIYNSKNAIIERFDSDIGN